MTMCPDIKKKTKTLSLIYVLIPKVHFNPMLLRESGDAGREITDCDMDLASLVTSTT